MKTPLLLSLLLIGCTSAPAPTDGERGTWKASTKSDYPATCAGVCGGRSRGLCYCDDACSAWGDCCPDYAPVCSAPADLMPDAHDAGADLWPSTSPYPSTPPDWYPSDLGPGTFGDLAPFPSSAPDLAGNPWGPADLGPWTQSDLGPWSQSDLGPWSQSDLSPADQISRSFHGTFMIDRYDNHTGERSQVPIGYSCIVTGPRYQVVVDCTGSFQSSPTSFEGGSFSVALAQPGSPVIYGLLHGDSQLEVDSYYLYTADYSDSLPGTVFISYDVP